MSDILLGGSISTTGTPILGKATVNIGDTNHTLSVNEYTNNFLHITSSVPLTAVRNIVAPLVQGQSFIVQNSTTGGFDIQVIGSSGTGVIIPSNATMFIVTDGTNYFSPQSSSSANQANIAALRLITGSTSTAAIVDSYSTASDGGSGIFIWDGSSTATDDGGTIIKPTSVSGAGRWLRVYTGELDIRWFGGVVGSYCDAAMTAAMNALPPALGGEIFFPVGQFKFASTITWSTKRITIRGSGASSQPTCGTELKFDAGIAGINVFQTAGQGANSRICDLRITGSDVSLGTNDGITISASNCEVQRVEIETFGRHGLYVKTSLGSPDPTHSANGCRFDQIRVTSCYGDGIRTEGADANSCVFTNISTTTNGHNGIYENSLIGNIYIGVLSTADNNSNNPLYANFHIGTISRGNYVIGLYCEDGNTYNLTIDGLGNNYIACNNLNGTITDNGVGASVITRSVSGDQAFNQLLVGHTGGTYNVAMKDLQLLLLNGAEAFFRDTGGTAVFLQLAQIVSGDPVADLTIGSANTSAKINLQNPVRLNAVPVTTAPSSGDLLYFDSADSRLKAWRSGDTNPRVLDEVPIYINVKDFGALGNGIHDDAPHIQKAINYLASGGITSHQSVGGTFPTGFANPQMGAYSPSFVAGSLLKDNPASPTVTVSGTPNKSESLYVEVTTPGGYGVGQFKYSTDYITYVTGVTISATVTLTGTGLTLHFPNTSYTNDIYRGTYFPATEMLIFWGSTFTHVYFDAADQSCNNVCAKVNAAAGTTIATNVGGQILWSDPTGNGMVLEWADTNGSNVPEGTLGINTFNHPVYPLGSKYGGTVFIPPGEFRVNSEIGIPCYINVLGSGVDDTQLSNYSLFDGISITGPINGTLGMFNSIKDLTFRHITSSGVSKGAGIAQLGNSFTTLDNVKVWGFRFNYVFSGTEFGYVHDCFSYEGVVSGIYIPGTDEFLPGQAGGQITNVLSFDNWVSEGDNISIIDEGGVNHVFTGGAINPPAGPYGMWIAAPQLVTFTNLYTETGDALPVRLDYRTYLGQRPIGGTYGFTMDSCEFGSHTGVQPVTIYSASNITFRNNGFNGSGWASAIVGGGNALSVVCENNFVGSGVPVIDNPSTAETIITNIRSGGYGIGVGVADSQAGIDIRSSLAIRPMAFTPVDGYNVIDLTSFASLKKFGNLELGLGLTPTANFSIKGIIGGSDGFLLKISNFTGFGVTFKHRDGTVSAGNQITCPVGNDYVIPPTGINNYEIISLRYTKNGLGGSGFWVIEDDAAIPKGSNEINALFFGAKNDASADSAPAFQKAINYLASGGKTSILSVSGSFPTGFHDPFMEPFLQTNPIGPAITITGTPNKRESLAIYITSTGSGTTAIFEWTNDYITFHTGITAGPSISLTGTGLTVSFAAGTYTNGERYLSRYHESENMLILFGDKAVHVEFDSGDQTELQVIAKVNTACGATVATNSGGQILWSDPTGVGIALEWISIDGDRGTPGVQLGIFNLTHANNEANMHGGTVFFPEGDYTLNSEIILASKVDVKGNGITSTYFHSYSGTNGITMLTPINSLSDGQNTLSNFTIKAVGATTGGGIVQINNAFTVVEKVRSYAWKYNFVIMQSEIVVIRDCQSNVATRAGFYFPAGDEFYPGGLGQFTNVVKLEGNWCNGDYIGILDEGGASHSIIGGGINSSTLYGVYLAGCINITLINFYMETGVAIPVYISYLTEAGNTDGSCVTTTFETCIFAPLVGVQPLFANSVGILNIRDCDFTTPASGPVTSAVLAAAFQINVIGNSALMPIINDPGSLPGLNSNGAGGVSCRGVGIGVTVPQAGLDVGTGIAIRAHSLFPANGSQTVDLSFGVSTRFQGNIEMLTGGGASADFSIKGITGGSDGHLVTFTNLTGYGITFVHRDGSVTAGSRISTPDAVDYVVAPKTLPAYSVTKLRYSSSGFGGTGYWVIE